MIVDLIKKRLDIKPKFKVLLVLAIGRPKEKAVIDPVGPDNDIKYWRDTDMTHHVPKRDLKDIILECY